MISGTTPKDQNSQLHNFKIQSVNTKPLFFSQLSKAPRRARAARRIDSERKRERQMRMLKPMPLWKQSHAYKEVGEAMDIIAGGAFATAAAGLMGYWLGAIIGGETGGVVGAAIGATTAIVGFFQLVKSGSKPAQ